MLLLKAATFSRVRVTDLGSRDQVDGTPDTLDNPVTVWTRCTPNENPFATVEVRGALDPRRGLVWLPDDAQVEVVEPPRYAGRPDILIQQAPSLTAPDGSKGIAKTPQGWPALVWESDIVYAAVQGWTDPEIAVEVLLCALAATPDTHPEVRDVLLAALNARHARVAKDPDTYPPTRYPWRGRTGPGADMLDYLRG